MFTFFLILSFVIFSNAFYIKSTSIIKKTNLYCNKHNVKKAIQIFNIIDIIQPNSISKFVQYKLFFRTSKREIVETPRVSLKNNYSTRY